MATQKSKRLEDRQSPMHSILMAECECLQDRGKKRVKLSAAEKARMNVLGEEIEMRLEEATQIIGRALGWRKPVFGAARVTANSRSTMKRKGPASTFIRLRRLLVCTEEGVCGYHNYEKGMSEPC